MTHTPLDHDLRADETHEWSWRKPPVPSPSRVTAIQAQRSYPCISVLMSTTASRRMTSTDVSRLRALVVEAGKRLRAERPSNRHDGILDQLERITAHATAQPTDAALALYASASFCEIVHLPVPVRDRVVINPTFATRDLVRSLHHTPRHVILVLTATDARLFHGVADTLQPALRSRFPLHSDTATPEDGRARSGGTRSGRRDTDTLAFLRSVDRALGAALRLHPSPLVLVGPERLLATFRGLSRNLDRLAGTVTGSHATAPLPRLVGLVRPVLDTYLHSRKAEALDLLERRIGARRAVTGIADTWLAAKHERPEMLVVEDTLVYPARLTAGGDLLVPADDVDAPDVIDDAVDELMKIVLQRGGWVALAEDGVLAGHDRVALTLRDKG